MSFQRCEFIGGNSVLSITLLQLKDICNCIPFPLIYVLMSRTATNFVPPLFLNFESPQIHKSKSNLFLPTLITIFLIKVENYHIEVHN